MKKKIIGAVALVLGTGAALAAAAIPAPGVIASPEPVAGIIYEAEAYATPDRAAEKGMQEAIRRCMEVAGFDYTPPVADMILDLNQAIGFKRLTVDLAKSRGYAFATPQGTPEPEPSSPEGLLFADPAFAMALKGDTQTLAPAGSGMGTTTGGCRGEAMTAIYGSPENYMLATGVAYNSFFPASLASVGDAGITKAVQNWEACMKESPYASYTSPFEAFQAGRSAGGQEEFRIAVTDAVCRDQTGFHAALDNVLDKYLTTRMQELAPEIARVKEIRRTAAANAEALTAPSSAK